MWKRFYLVILFLSDPALSKFSPNHVINNILDRLRLNLNYISRHYDKINVDCLFGVVLAGAILDDTIIHPGSYQQMAEALRNKTRDIYQKTLPLMQNQSTWNNFAKHIVVPDLWSKQLRYKVSEFRMAYAMKSRVEALFSKETYENYTEGFSDNCLAVVVNSTLGLKPQTICRLSPKCEEFVENLDSGSGYILTHKLLLLQVARTRKCKMHPKLLVTAVKKICNAIYTETISVEYFIGLNEIFDLFLEQILLCGFEGYADFLKRQWLEKILKIQFDSGCFPVSVSSRIKRETNILEDGCADHTTGLGAGVLSLYLNYVLKNEETIALISGWY